LSTTIQDVAWVRRLLKLSRLIETRADFQAMAEDRLEEAKVLLDQARWNGAYYLAGYAVELALKACIIKMLLARDAFPEKEFSRNCYTHDVEKLVGLAGLESAWKIATAADPDLKTNWVLVKDWSEEKRYHRSDRAEAEALFAAIADPLHGVLPWIKTYW
jgi:HEPN domain-containing protein